MLQTKFQTIDAKHAQLQLLLRYSVIQLKHHYVAISGVVRAKTVHSSFESRTEELRISYKDRIYHKRSIELVPRHFSIQQFNTATTMDNINSTGQRRVEMYKSYFRCGATPCGTKWTADKVNVPLFYTPCPQYGKVVYAWDIVSFKFLFFYRRASNFQYTSSIFVEGLIHFVTFCSIMRLNRLLGICFTWNFIW